MLNKILKVHRELIFFIILTFIIIFSLKQDFVWTESNHVKKVKIEKAIWKYLDKKEKLLVCKKQKKDCKNEVITTINAMKKMDKVIFNKK